MLRVLSVQVLYTLDPNTDWKVALALAGGRGDDVAVTLNPVAGRGLTHLVRLGCSLHQACQGVGPGFSWRATEDATLAALVLHDGASVVFCILYGVLCDVMCPGEG